jgi:hypothetical protein
MKRTGNAKKTNLKTSQSNTNRKKILDVKALVYQMILDSYKTREIYFAINEKYGLSSRQVDRYIAHCYRELDRQLLDQVDVWRKKKKKQLEGLYNKALREKDYQECRQIITTENKIFGYEQIKVEHNINGVLLQKIKDLFFVD